MNRSNHCNKSHEAFIKELGEKRPELECLGTYTTNHDKIQFRHIECGNVWEAKPNKILSAGRGCPKCGGPTKKTHEEFISQLKEKRPDVICLEPYITYNTKLLFQSISCGHQFYTTPHCIFGAKYCPVCLKLKKNRIITLEERHPTILCKMCRVRKPRIQFRQIKSLDKNCRKTAQVCLECEPKRKEHRRQVRQKQYYNNPEVRRERTKQYNIRNRERTLNIRRLLKDAVIFKKGGRCQCCQLLLSAENQGCCFDFHHINPDSKEGRMSNMLGNLFKLSNGDTIEQMLNNLESILTEEVIQELNKCIVVCSNCHRKIHAGFITIDPNTTQPIPITSTN